MNESLIEIRYSEQTSDSQNEQNEILKSLDYEKIVQLRQKIENLKQQIEDIFQNLKQDIPYQKKNNIDNYFSQICQIMPYFKKIKDLTKIACENTQTKVYSELDNFPIQLLRMKSSEESSKPKFQKSKIARFSYDRGVIQKIKQNLIQLKQQRERLINKTNKIQNQLKREKILIQSYKQKSEINDEKELILFKQFIKQMEIGYQLSKIEFNNYAQLFEASLIQACQSWLTELSAKQSKMKIQKIIQILIDPNQQNSNQSSINRTKFNSYYNQDLRFSIQVDPSEDQIIFQEQYQNDATHWSYPNRYSIIPESQIEQVNQTNHFSSIISEAEGIYNQLSENL